MKIRKYTENSVEEALPKIREELGPDAVILHTREVNKPGLLGKLGAPMVEITAAVDTIKQYEKEALQSSPGPVNKFKKTIISDQHVDEVKQELGQLKSFVQVLGRQVLSESENEGDVYRELVDNEIDEKIVMDILASIRMKYPDEKMPNDAILWRLAQTEISKRINVSPINLNEKTKIVSLVGPTGVGKTTTIAKLAAKYILEEKKSVALISIDKFRMAASEQIKSYGNILDIPVSIVASKGELIECVNKLTNKDIVFIDTAGKSPYNQMQVLEQLFYLRKLPNSEIHLVLGSNTKYRDNLKAVELFSTIGVNRYIFTKIDSTSSYGSILNIVQKKNIPISYITNGQNVPDDIEIADRGKIARLICKSSKAYF